ARLVWTADRRVLTAHQRSNGSTSGARLLHRTTSGALGTRPTDLRLAGSPTGAAVVSWQTTDDDEGPPIAGSEVRVMGRGGGGGGRARRLASPGAAGVAGDVCVARKGGATAVWREKARGPWSVRRATYRPRAGWTKARSFTGRGARAGTPRLAGRPAGRLTVA